MQIDINNLPLFSEKARRTDPRTSHDRAKSLSKTPKLTKQLLAVLSCISRNPGKTARQLGFHLISDTGCTDSFEWPHKAMKRLVNVNWVRREDSDGGMKCYATDKGRSILLANRKVQL